VCPSSLQWCVIFVCISHEEKSHHLQSVLLLFGHLIFFEQLLSDIEWYAGGGVCCIGETGRFSKAERENARQREKPYPLGGTASRGTPAPNMGDCGTVG